MKAVHPGTNVPPETLRFRYDALRYLGNVVRDPKTPFEEAYDGASEMLAEAAHNKKLRSTAFAQLEGPLFANWPHEARLYLLKGQFNTRYAWDARGVGWASTVTDEGWKLFNERLEVAEKALTRAWELDPTLVAVAREMLIVEKGQGKGRPRMEMWFKRVMDLNPADFEACCLKLDYLHPKWHGSEEGHRHNYARCAYWCEQWNTLNKLIPLLGPVNYDYFGGRESFEKLLQAAKEHVEGEK